MRALRPTRLLSLAFAVLLFEASAGFGFQDQGLANPTIKSTTQLIQFIVIASGKRDSPAPNLVRENFRVRENGKEHPVAFFKKYDAVDQGTNPAAPARLGAFSNVLDTPQTDNRNILLLDRADTDPISWQRGLPQILEFLRGLKQTDHIAIYLLTSRGLQIVQDYMGDSASLRRRLQSSNQTTTSDSLSGLLPGEAAQSSPTKREGEIGIPELLRLGRTQGLTGAFEAIANHLSDVPGAKSLIWFAGKFPNAFSREDDLVLEASRIKLLRAVNHVMSANVAIFPISALGLMPDHALDAENEQLPVAPQGSAGVTTPYPFPDHDFSLMLEFARQSGGKAYFNTNGIGQAVRDAATLGSRRYILGFYVSEELDSKFHRLEVSVTEPGIHLKYKPGYWAVPAAAPLSLGEELQVILQSPFTKGGIQLQADGVMSKSHEMALDLFIDQTNLNLVRRATDWGATIEVLFTQKDLKGGVFGLPTYRVPISVTESSAATHRWLTTHANILVRPQSKIIRVVVRDAITGNVGSIDIPVSH